MSVVVGERRELGDECQHWDDEGSRLTGTWARKLNFHTDNVPRKPLTCFCDTNNIPSLQTDRDGLPLDRRGLLVTDLVNDFKNLHRDG